MIHDRVNENGVYIYQCISYLDFLRSREKILISELIDSVETLRNLSIHDVRYLIGRTTGPDHVNWDQIEAAVAADSRYLTAREIMTIFYGQREYPPLLREMYDPPFALHVRGVLPNYEKPLVAMVGTRKPTGNGRNAAFALAHELGSCNLDVVSGLAYGVDGAAHLGNLQAGGSTVAVLGCGIDRVYPAGHRGLARQILMNDGCIVSEYRCGTPPLPYHFPQRNRIVSGLCRGVVIVEAPAKSGALITADFALEQNRDVMVHRDGLVGAASKGTRDLAEHGAFVVASAADVIMHMNLDIGIAGGVGIRHGATSARDDGVDSSAGALEQEIEGRATLYNGRLYYRARGPLSTERSDRESA